MYLTHKLIVYISNNRELPEEQAPLLFAVHHIMSFAQKVKINQFLMGQQRNQ